MADAAHGHDIVVVGASAGGVEALRSMIAFLPADLDATLFVVLHLPAAGTSVLPQILERAGLLRAVHASDCEAFERAQIYVAPPDQHMKFADGTIRLDRGPTVNGHRPAVDPMFSAAAEVYGGRVTGVILSGVLDDGAAGLQAVAAAGGAALVQAPSDALYPTMPTAALEAVPVAYEGDTEMLAQRIVALTSVPPIGPAPSAPVPSDSDAVRLLEVERGATGSPQPGETTGLTCPECHGSLWEAVEGRVVKYRCRTGHEFTAESLAVQQSEHVERALWAALRALEEKATMFRRMSSRFERRGSHATSVRLARKAENAVHQAVVMRGLLETLDSGEEVLEEQRS
jgi:two-component system, chemotaxis family, protein-glutamate methylesterase/glutaminase